MAEVAVARPIIGGVLLAMTLVACSGQRSFRTAAPAAVDGGDERFERAACDRGEYPPAIDAAAMAWARQQDLRASRAALSAPLETERVLAARAAFEGRCRRWRREGGAPRAVEASSLRVAP